MQQKFKRGGLLLSKLEFDKLRIDLWVSGTADKEGNGGYCALLYCNMLGRPYIKTLGGYGSNTTVTRMTLKAVIAGLRAIKQKAFIHIYTQIPQVSSGLNKYIYEWSKNNWKRKDGGELQHADLWQEIYDLLQQKSLHYKVHYQKESPNPDYNLVVIHRSSEYAMRAKKTLKEVVLP
jgi:ribonuclease HI